MNWNKWRVFIKIHTTLGTLEMWSNELKTRSDTKLDFKVQNQFYTARKNHSDTTGLGREINSTTNTQHKTLKILILQYHRVNKETIYQINLEVLQVIEHITQLKVQTTNHFNRVCMSKFFNNLHLVNWINTKSFGKLK